MPPPPAELFATRIFLGPALRVQPDGRLVGLVREGYDSAFEEIVRRYRRPLERFAAAIVGGRSEDVTQDAFSKALQALRGSEAEIELRPWLYRIVRNTALNDLRDRGPAPEQLSEALAGAGSAAAEVERREELADLMNRLRALPEPQRAAIVMRELEGLSHEEIASALGVSGGAARQAIYRARAALRDGLGLLVPLPVLRALVDHGGALGGLGAGGALKVGAATLLVAGTVAGGVAIEQHQGSSGPEAAAAAPLAEKSGAQAGSAHGTSSAARDSRQGHGSGAARSRGDGTGSNGDHSGPGSAGNLSAGSGTRTASRQPSDHSGAADGGHGGSGGGGESGPGGGEHSGLQTNGSDDGSGDGSSSGGSGSDDGSISDGSSSSSEDGTSSGSSGDGGGEQTPTGEPVVEETSGDTESSSGSDGSGDGSGDLVSSSDSTESTSGSDGSP